MSIENIKLIIAAVASAMGALSIFLVWVFAIETKRGANVLQYSGYKHFVNVTFLFFILISAAVWFTTTSADTLLVWAYLWSAVLWFASGFAIFVLSIFTRNAQNRSAIRATLLSCLVKSLVSALILLFIA